MNQYKAKKLKSEVSFNEVVWSWLADEWHYNFYSKDRNEFSNAIIEHPDFSNETENKTRYDLLFRNRHNMLDKIPSDTIWYSVDFTNEDIDRIFLIPATWCLKITHGSYRLVDAVNNTHKGERDITGEAVKRIQEISHTHPDSIPGKFVFIASSLTSPFTTIEGNHRIIAFGLTGYKTNFLKDAYLGISNQMIKSKIHIEYYL